MTRLSKNVIYNLMGYVTIATMGFIAVKFIYHDLGDDALGLIYYTSMLNALILMLMDLGISATTMREVSVYFKEDPKYINELIRTGSAFYWVAFILFGILAYFLAPFIVKNWINLATMKPEKAIYIIRVLFIASLFALPQSLYMSLFKGLQRMEYNNYITVFFTIIRQLGAVIILWLDGTLNQIVYLHAACYSLPILVYLFTGFQFFPKIAFIPGFFFRVIKRNLEFISKLTLQTIVLAVYQQIDKIIISKFMPIGVLGFYSFAFSNVQRAAIVQHSIVVAAFPSFSALFGKKNFKGLMAQYRQLQDIICFGNVPFFTLILFMLRPIFSYLFKPEVVEIMQVPTILLCLGAYINGTLRLPYTFATAIGKPEINVKNDFYALIAILPVSAFLVFQYGLVGAGIAFILRYLFGYFYAVPRYCKECFHIPIIKWYGHIFKTTLTSLLTYGIAWLVLSLKHDFSIISLLIAYSSATIAYLLVSFLLIGTELRENIQHQIHLVKSKIMQEA